MTSKEIIKSCIAFTNPPRIGLDFNAPHQSDILWIRAAGLESRSNAVSWGHHAGILEKVPGFNGEVMTDAWGIIYGRLDALTKGEPVKGPLEDGWELLDTYEFPEINWKYYDEIRPELERNKDRYILGAMPCSPFATMRDLRRMDNLFVDLLTCEEKVMELNAPIEKLMLEIIEACSAKGFDGIVIYEDWGIQNSLLISPALWKKIFKPVYRRLIDHTHSRGMAFFVHSCGYIYEIIEDFIETGVDVFQFDQPELAGVERLSKEFGGRVSFWCPVDIQKVMVTGDRALIESNARKMLDCFGRFKGGFIAKDYPQWDAIGVKEEWAQWARDVFTQPGAGVD